MSLMSHEEQLVSTPSAMRGLGRVWGGFSSTILVQEDGDRCQCEGVVVTYSEYMYQLSFICVLSVYSVIRERVGLKCLIICS